MLVQMRDCFRSTPATTMLTSNAINHPPTPLPGPDSMIVIWDSHSGTPIKTIFNVRGPHQPSHPAANWGTASHSHTIHPNCSTFLFAATSKWC